MAVDLIAYRRSIIDLPPEQTPLTRIVRQVDAFERGRHGGRHDDIDAMAKQAARQAVFAYELVLALEAEAASFARRYEAVMLLTLHRLIDEIRECCRTDEEGLSCISHHRAPGAAARAAELYEQEREARLRLEEQYLGGRSTLFPATVAAWDRLEGHADMLSIVLTHRFARAVPLVRLSPMRMQGFLNAKTAAGLSPRSVAYIRAVARQALGQAERWGLVSRNVAKLVDPPRVPRRPVHPFEPHEVQAFLAAIDGDRLEALHLAAIGTGLRQGELLGLAWHDVELDAGTLTVRHALQRIEGELILVEPKSATSHRTIALPDFVRAALRAHRTRQREAQLLAGSRWQHDERDLVFRTTIGTPLDGITVTRRLQRLLKAAGLRHQRFHDLRHACASLMLAQGVAPRVVMEVLGHSQISLTMGTYAHVGPALGRSAAEGMDSLMRAMSGPSSAA